MPNAEKLAKKTKYFTKLIENIEKYPNILVVDADFVGSKQLQNVRIALRGRAVVLMGKNTMIRTALRSNKDKYPHLGLDKLVSIVRGNIGFIFCIDSMDAIREVVAEHKVPAAAKAGVISSCEVVLPPGPCGLDPSMTAFFQALNIATKIVKGAIELINQCTILAPGQKVNLSEQVLLQKLNIKPFFYGLKVIQVYQDGAVFDAAVLDITDDILMGKWANGVGHMAAFSREIGVPSAASLPHALSASFKNVAALVAEIDFTFKEVEQVKEFFKDPSAFACAAGPATGGGGGGGGAAPAAVAAAAVEEEEEEEEMDFDLFG